MVHPYIYIYVYVNSARGKTKLMQVDAGVEEICARASCSDQESDRTSRKCARTFSFAEDCDYKSMQKNLCSLCACTCGGPTTFLITA